MSTPSSSALVATTPRISPSRRPARSRAAPSAGSRRDSRGPACAARALAEGLAQTCQDDLDRDPRPPEHDRLAAGPEEGQRPRWASVSGRAPRAGGRVEQRRIHEQDVPLAGGRAVAIDQARRAAGQLRGELGRVPDRGRAADDDRIGAVVGADRSSRRRTFATWPPNTPR